MKPQHIGTDTIPPRYPHLHPDALAQADEAEQAAELALADYVQDWIDGDLYDDGEVYTGPIQRMLDDDLADRLGAMLDHHKAGRVEALRVATESLLRELEKQIRKGAE